MKKIDIEKNQIKKKIDIKHLGDYKEDDIECIISVIIGGSSIEEE